MTELKLNISKHITIHKTNPEKNKKDPDRKNKKSFASMHTLFLFTFFYYVQRFSKAREASSYYSPKSFDARMCFQCYYKQVHFIKQLFVPVFMITIKIQKTIQNDP